MRLPLDITINFLAIMAVVILVRALRKRPLQGTARPMASGMTARK